MLGSNIIVINEFRKDFYSFLNNLKILASPKETQAEWIENYGIGPWKLKNNISITLMKLDFSLLKNDRALMEYLSTQELIEIKIAFQIIENLLKDDIPTHTIADLDLPVLEKVRAEARNLVLNLRDAENRIIDPSMITPFMMYPFM